MCILANAQGILQKSALISKTDQVDISGASPALLGVMGYRFITLFMDYTKVDETGLLVIPWYAVDEAGAAAGKWFQDGSWSAAAGQKTFTANSYKMTATGLYQVVFDIGGKNWMKFTQGGSNNDGTNLGSLAVSYILTTS